MIKHSGKFIVFFLFIFLTFPSFASPYDDKDWQYWNVNAVAGPLTENIHFNLTQYLFFGDDISELYYSITHPSVHFKITDWYTIAPGLWHIYEKKGDKWYNEERPMLDNLFGFMLADWIIVNRARISYRIRDNLNDVWRFRYLTKLIAPLEWTPWNICPFIADEIFFEENQRGLYANRLYVGLMSKNLLQHDALNGSLFFMWQTVDVNFYYLDTYVFGTEFKIHF